MKALLLNPIIPYSYWSMRYACKLQFRKAFTSPLGLITAAALLPPEWDLRLIDLNVRKLVESDWDWADLIMISGMIVQREDQVRLIREAKKRNKRVVVGGPYVSSVPEGVLAAGADYLVLGEGENSIPPFLEALERGVTSGVFKPEVRPNMEISPIPRFDLLDMNAYSTMAVQTCRGCPFDCEFCDIVNLYGRRPRYKSPEQVLAELDELYRLGWRREIFVTDDNFVGSKAHSRALLRKLIPWMESHRKPFGFATQCSVNLGQDLELIDLMTEANFSNICVGVESPDEEVLRHAGKQHNIRNPLAESLETIRRNGITVMASFIVGFDNEEKGAAERICRFADQNDLPMVIINALQALPNTKLWDRLESEGRLLPDRTTGDASWGVMNFIPARPESEIREEFFKAVEHFYEPSRFFSRIYRFYLPMRPTRAAMAKAKGEPLRQAVVREPLPLHRKLIDLLSFLRILWRHGVASGPRIQFWKQLRGIARKNPSRFIRYLNSCAIAKDIFLFRKALLKTKGNGRPPTPS